MSRKKTPAWYGEPAACRKRELMQSGQCMKALRAIVNLLDGPIIVDTHSYMLSPFGPAEQLHGGSRLISASSF